MVEDDGFKAWKQRSSQYFVVGDIIFPFDVENELQQDLLEAL